MLDHDPLNWWHQLALIIVRQDVAPLPDEFIFDCLAPCFLDRRNEEKIARLMHGCIHRIPVSTMISLVEPFRGLANPQRVPVLVGLHVYTRLAWEGRPSLR